MDAAELRPILRRTADAARLTAVPTDPADRAAAADEAEAAGATILRFAAYCRGEDDHYGVCKHCGMATRLTDIRAAHPSEGCWPFKSLWHAVRLTRIVRGRLRYYTRRIRGGA